jgi:hypothetical protein
MRLLLASCCLALSACGSPVKSSDMAMMTVMDMSAPIIDAGPAECDPVANSGCMSGDKCTIGTDNGGPRAICFPVAAAPVPEGGDCMSVTMGARVGDNCAAGLSCVVYATEGAKCRRPCFLRQDCPTGSACVVRTVLDTIETVDGGAQFELRSCHSDDGCDPVAQDKCSGGKSCYLSLPDDAGRVGVCLMPMSTKTTGATCSNISDCAPGFRCDSFMFCRRYCYYRTASGDIPTTGQCPASEGMCDLFPGGNDLYGVCGSL